MRKERQNGQRTQKASSRPMRRNKSESSLYALLVWPADFSVSVSVWRRGAAVPDSPVAPSLPLSANQKTRQRRPDAKELWSSGSHSALCLNAERIFFFYALSLECLLSFPHLFLFSWSSPSRVAECADFLISFCFFFLSDGLLGILFKVRFSRWENFFIYNF